MTKTERKHVIRLTYEQLATLEGVVFEANERDVGLEQLYDKVLRAYDQAERGRRV